MNNNRILFVYGSVDGAKDTAYRGCGFYRCITPAEYLKDDFTVSSSYTTAPGFIKDLSC